MFDVRDAVFCVIMFDVRDRVYCYHVWCERQSVVLACSVTMYDVRDSVVLSCLE